MTYTKWGFTSPGLDSIDSDVQIDRLDRWDRDGFFLSCYQGDIGNTLQYHGIQSTTHYNDGPGNTMFIASFFNPEAIIDAVAARRGRRQVIDPFVVESGEEGGFVGLRAVYPAMVAGSYLTSLRRTKGDRKGDWFEFAVAYPGSAAQVIGAVKIARTGREPLTIDNGGITFTEFWPNSVPDNLPNPGITPVPRWAGSVLLLANEGRQPERPNRANSWYSSMPNSNIVVDGSTGVASFEIGNGTRRCNIEDSVMIRPNPQDVYLPRGSSAAKSLD